MIERVKKTPERGTKVGEAQIAYLAPPPPVNVIETSVTRLSGKNQVTIPVAMVRMLGLKPGDELALLAMNGAIYVEKQLRGRELHEQLRGSMKHVPEWSTKEAIDAYIRDGREDDDE